MKITKSTNKYSKIPNSIKKYAKVFEAFTNYQNYLKIPKLPLSTPKYPYRDEKRCMQRTRRMC